MFPYAKEHFEKAEEAVLRRYFTNLDQPVFALVNLPEVVKGALFARYSRSPKTLRRLFLDEFVDDLDMDGDETVDATMGLARAEELYKKVFLEYGDDSVAQLGGVHLACEQSSNLLTKILERGRLMAYLEQSTRYIGYDNRLPSGHYRYFRPPSILESKLGTRYIGDMDRMFDAYGDLLPSLVAWLGTRYPKAPEDLDMVHRRALRAKALDALRGLLPASSLSNVGMYGTAQSYELLLLHLRTNPLPEARAYGEMILTELRKVIPSFLQRVDLADRGGLWSSYLSSNAKESAKIVEELFDETSFATQSEGVAPLVQLLDFDPDGEEKVLAAICFPNSGVSERSAFERVRRLSLEERSRLLCAYVGDRSNRRHRPGRAFERTDYRFEVVTDYGAFRDLQRHRMLTIEWQPLSPTLGYDTPDLIQEAHLADEFSASLERSEELYGDLIEDFPSEAPYAVALAFKIRYTMQMNAREACHVLELRSGPQGHPSYREVAQKMHRAIEQVAGHRAIAAAMTHVDHGNSEIERLESERRAEEKRRKAE